MDHLYVGFFEEHGPQVRAEILKTLIDHSGLTPTEAIAVSDHACRMANAVEIEFASVAQDAPEAFSGDTILVAIGLCLSIFTRMQEDICCTAREAGEELADRTFSLHTVN